MSMIKGVGRYAVEVESVESEFFERIICFVRPQYAGGNGLDLHREALRVAGDLSADVEDAQHGPKQVLRVGATRQVSRPTADRPLTRRPSPEPERPSRRNGWLPILLSAGGGAAAAMLITSLL